MAPYVIVAPVYNGEATLPRFFEELAKLDLLHEVVVSDDLSGDRSREVARGFTPHVVDESVHTGVGGCIKRGLAYAAARFPDAPFVIKIDTDGQHRVDLLPRVVEKLEEGFDLVAMSRFHPESTQIATPLNRRYLNRTFAQLLSEETGWDVSDSRTGFMGFTMPIARMLSRDLIIKGYGLPIEIMLRTHAMNPDARFASLPHPAVYGGETLTPEHRKRYEGGGETAEQMASRWKDAAYALFAVRESLGRVN
jgi:glycosyltransferase involved in cell wall biosynthesis